MFQVRIKYVYLLVVVLLMRQPALSQTAPVNFHHLSVKNGLNDGIINAITEDKYGYMWFASYGALNRFNGTTIKKYEHVMGDSSSAPGGIVYALYCSSEGRLFIGGEEGLREFNYNTGKFIPVPVFSKIRITAIAESAANELLVLGNNQVWRFRLDNRQKSSLLQSWPAGINPSKIFSLFKKDNRLYLGAKGAYLLYDLKSGGVSGYTVPQLQGAAADAVMPDALGNIWINNVFQFRLLRIDQRSGEVREMDKDPLVIKNGVQQQFLDFVADSENVWIATSLKGLIRYNVQTGAMGYYQKNLLNPGSIANNILRALYLSKDGTVWISMLGGIDYFHPSKNIFEALFPFPSYDANQFARGFTEDIQGNYWFSTGDGIARYNSATGQYRVWQNESGKSPVIYYNSARAVLADGNNVWIATGKGVNRYDIAADRMHFLTAKDSLPELFYLNINKDSKGKVWFCTNMQDGLYYYDPASEKIHSICRHPVLKRFCGYSVRRVFEDTHKRLWLGFSGQGYAVYDPATASVKYWYNSSGGDSSFNSNLVIDIAEDRKGVVWLTTFNGVRGVDILSNKTYWLTVKNGLRSNVTNGIKCDAYNRLWIGTSAGLSLVDSNRKTVYQFDESFGFPSMEFPEH
ncbi:MAG: two-component regulator propeller domain-containing protein [Ferruginibacter sp.]